MDGSRRSAHANAYFTGLGASKRVVFFDTLLERLSPGEVEAVLAHELGHFKHVTCPSACWPSSAPAWQRWRCWAGWRSSSGSTPGWASCPTCRARPNDALALLLFMLALPPFTFLVTPLAAAAVARHEFEADAYACPRPAGKTWPALVKLHEDNAAR
jgi:STE24 endopeptidase